MIDISLNNDKPIDQIVVDGGIMDYGVWDEGVVGEVVMHIVVVGVMFAPSHLHLILYPPGRSAWVHGQDLSEMVGLTPLPVPLDKEHMEAVASLEEIRLGGLSPLMTNRDSPAEIVVEADLRKPPIADHKLRHCLKH